MQLIEHSNMTRTWYCNHIFYVYDSVRIRIKDDGGEEISARDGACDNFASRCFRGPQFSSYPSGNEGPPMAKKNVVYAAVLTPACVMVYWFGGGALPCLCLSPDSQNNATPREADWPVYVAPQTFSETNSPTSLTPSKVQFDFGDLPKGGRAQQSFWLHNPGESTVEIRTIETSCACFQVLLPSKIVGPKEKISATIKLDFAHNTSFAGKLAMDAIGRAISKDTVAFAIHVSVLVKDVSE